MSSKKTQAEDTTAVRAYVVRFTAHHREMWRMGRSEGQAATDSETGTGLKVAAAVSVSITPRRYDGGMFVFTAARWSPCARPAAQVA
jgi:hypothetical protein